MSLVKRKIDRPQLTRGKQPRERSFSAIPASHYNHLALTVTSIETAHPNLTFLYATVPVCRANSWRAVDQAMVEGLHEVGIVLVTAAGRP